MGSCRIFPYSPSLHPFLAPGRTLDPVSFHGRTEEALTHGEASPGWCKPLARVCQVLGVLDLNE